MARVVLYAPDTVPGDGRLASGPGIRAREVAAALERCGHSVLLASPDASGDATWTPSSAAALARRYRAEAAIVGQGNAELGRRLARDLRDSLPLVVDCYAPGIVENALLAPDARAFPGFVRRAREVLGRGDLFLVANAGQRLFLLGELAACGRLNPTTIAQPPIVEVGYGVPAESPPTPRAGSSEDRTPTVLWYGGIYPWFDATTAVRGFAQALEISPEARLVIAGGAHPRDHAPTGELERARAEARVLGIGDRVREVPWVPYDARATLYEEADCAICLQHAGVEAELAHRTRLLDLIWGRLPFVCSEGDHVGQMAVEAGGALSVPIGDATAVATALVALLERSAANDERRARLAALAGTLTWDHLVRPLAGFVSAPRVAEDRAMSVTWRSAASAAVEAARNRRQASAKSRG